MDGAKESENKDGETENEGKQWDGVFRLANDQDCTMYVYILYTICILSGSLIVSSFVDDDDINAIHFSTDSVLIVRRQIKWRMLM